MDQQFPKYSSRRVPEGSRDTLHALPSVPYTRPDKKIWKFKDVLWSRYFETGKINV